MTMVVLSLSFINVVIMVWNERFGNEILYEGRGIMCL